MRNLEIKNVYKSKPHFLLIAVFLSIIGIFFINDFASDSSAVLHSYAKGQLIALLFGATSALLISNIDYHFLSFLWGFPLLSVLLVLSFLGRWQIFPSIFRMTDDEYLLIGGLSINLPALALLSICTVLTLIVYKCEKLNTMLIPLLGVICGTCFFFNARITMIVFMIILAMLFLKKSSATFFDFFSPTVISISVIVSMYANDQFEILNTESRKRIGMWLHPADYHWNTGYEIGYSIYDIARGGIFGTGIGTGGAESALYDEVLDSYILSGIIREIGWFGMIFILIIYVLLFWEGVKIAQRAADKLCLYRSTFSLIPEMDRLLLDMGVVN